MSNSTGTYLIFETTKPEINIELIYNNKVYVGNKIILAIEGDKYIFIIQYNIVKEEILNEKQMILKDSLENYIHVYK